VRKKNEDDRGGEEEAVEAKHVEERIKNGGKKNEKRLLKTNRYKPAVNCAANLNETV
jgi:hypothetical protein